MRCFGPLVFSHINPHSHHHINMSTSNCQDRVGAWDADASWAQVLSFFILFFHSTNILKLDYVYYNNTGQNNGRELERAKKRVDERWLCLHKTPTLSMITHHCIKPKWPSFGLGIYLRLLSTCLSPYLDAPYKKKIYLFSCLFRLMQLRMFI